MIYGRRGGAGSILLVFTQVYRGSTVLVGPVLGDGLPW